MPAVDADFVGQYVDLLAIQYWDQPNARAEIELQAGTWSYSYTFLRSFFTALDVDTAVGAQLDLLGGWVGVRRSVSGTSLSDADYRFFIKVKAARNWASAYLCSDDLISINDVVLAAFDGLAYVTDGQDMTLTLNVDPSIDPATVQLIQALDLLPKPMGVRYFIEQVELGGTFGFSDNPYSQGFADKNDPGIAGGIFANKVI